MGELVRYDQVQIDRDETGTLTIVGEPPTDVVWSPELIAMLHADAAGWARIDADGADVITLDVQPEPLLYRLTGERDGIDYVSERITPRGVRWPS